MNFIILAFALFLGLQNGEGVSKVESHAFTRDEVPFVPGVGSVWVSQMEETSASNNGDAKLTAREPEHFSVKVLRDGRPVFSGKTFGYSGKLTESAVGTLVYTDECEEKIPEKYFAPPEVANQCEWNVCVPPPVGTAYSRKMIVFAQIYSCEPKVGVYSMVSKRLGVTPTGEKAIIAEISVEFGPFQKTSWTGYFSLDGRGQIYSTSTNRVTKYSRVEVKPVPYTPQKTASLSQEIKIADLEKKGEEQKSCDIVAFGDSLTEGLGATKQTSYPVYLEKLFKESGKDMSVCNLGISGNTTSIASKRVQQVVGTGAKEAIVFLGANDVIQGLGEEVTRDNLEHIISELKMAGMQVVVVGLEVSGDAPRTHRALAQKFGVQFIPNGLAGIYGVKQMLSSDGRHPNEAGYKKLAENIFSVLAK